MKKNYPVLGKALLLLALLVAARFAAHSSLPAAHTSFAKPAAGVGQLKP